MDRNVKVKKETRQRVILFSLLSIILVIGYLIFADNNEYKKEIEESPKEVEEPISFTVDHRYYRVIVIDSCEYLQFKATNNFGLAHKGNCKFCAERAKRAFETEWVKRYNDLKKLGVFE